MSFGLSGNKENSSSSSTSTTESWLLDMMKPIIGDAVGNAGNMPEYGFAGLNQGQLEALEGIMGGQDWSGLQAGAGALGQMGWDQLTQGGNYLQGAMGQYKDIMGQLSGQGYQDLVQGNYNSDLVNQQIDVMTGNVQAGLDKRIQGINQASAGSGNMGSSRAGVAEGVAIGDASEAIAQGTTGIQGNAWNQALNTANKQLGNMLGAAGTQLQLGQNMVSQGMGGLNTAMNWGQGIGGGKQQDLFNKLTAGGIIQGNTQGQMDVDRLNQIIKDNPALGKLQLLLPVISGTAGWGSTTTGSGTSSGTNVGFNASFGNGNKNSNSDARLKDDQVIIREGEIHELENGEVYYVPRIYQWKWNDLAKALFEENGMTEIPPEQGVLAQELELIGLSDLVQYSATEVEGLDGKVRSVNYQGLYEFIKAVHEKVKTAKQA